MFYRTYTIFADSLKMGAFRLILYASVLVLISSCSEYGRIVKSGTTDEKEKMAKIMYDKKDFSRALPLYEDLLAVYRGKIESEEFYYYYSYCHYYIGQYELAAYHFQNFTENYYQSKHIEECSYMHLVCKYGGVYPYFLDQSETNDLINTIQIFVNKYPTSEYLDECNNMIKDLRKTLMLKSYNTGLLYMKLGDYLAASVSLKNTIESYPDIENKNEIEYLIVKACYLYAKNSVFEKKEERLEKVFEAYTEYTKHNKETDKYYSEAKSYNEKAKEELEKYQIIKNSK